MRLNAMPRSYPLGCVQAIPFKELIAVKVIFLDIDGVLNNDEWAERIWSLYRVDVCANYSLYQLAMELLKQLTNRTGAKIVITSFWQNITKAYSRLKEQFLLWDIDIYDCVPHTDKNTRGQDIKLWLEGHSNVDEFVILDDDDDMEDLMDRLVQVKYATGLTQEAVDQCVTMLGGANIEDN